MKNIFFLVLVITCVIPNYLSAQNLRAKDKQHLRKELKQMVKQDQFYRKMIATHPPNEQELWIKQTQNDSINKAKFVQLINAYGYPSLQRVGVEYSVLLILHFTNENDFYALEPIFKEQLQKNNLSPLEYARWYDRCQINMGKPNVYGVYGKKDFCGTELQKVNENRKQIGLENLTCP